MHKSEPLQLVQPMRGVLLQLLASNIEVRLQGIDDSSDGNSVRAAFDSYPDSGRYDVKAVAEALLEIDKYGAIFRIRCVSI